MNDQTTDLSALSRAPKAGGDDSAQASKIPMPRVRWRTRILLPGLILLATASLIGISSRGALLPARDVQVAPVLVKEDRQSQRAGEVIVQAPGWVEADPYSTAATALADGVVEEVLVLEGEQVEQGQIVARLVPDDAMLALDQAEARLAEQQATASAAAAVLEEARRNWEHPIELRRALHTAEARLAEKRAELARWPSELGREKALSVHMRAEYDRLAPLHESGVAGDIELIRAEQGHLAQLAKVESVRQEKPILEAQIQALEAEVEAARRNLELRIADTRALAEAEAAVQQARAAVASAQARRDEAALRLERMEVRSPVHGIVMARLVEPGSKVMLGMDDPRSAQVVRLYDPKRLQVRVDVPLADAARIGLGQPAEVVVDVLPDQVFGGSVSRVVHEADVQKNTLQFKVAIENPSPEIKPEMLARARFLAAPDGTKDAAGRSSEVLLVPERAVVREGGEAFVWLADPIDEVARRRGVSLGRVGADGSIAVLDGLRPGDRVIVDPPADIEDGKRIRAFED